MRSSPRSAPGLEPLRAGAYLSVPKTLPEGEAVDTVSARAYRHEALGSRPVVRLVPDALAPGEDLVLDFLGFAKPTVESGIAIHERRALGFPGWALVNDPKRAKLALDVVREFKKAARHARTKPGQAKEELDAIGRKLGASVPHFVPSFYEEAGRVFIEAGNATYAAQAFNKAREAEKVHALRVDEAQRGQAFLDFALSGALTTKALSEYARDLETSHDAATAYAHFRDLCVRRTLGGMAPWAGMPKDLRRLAKAADLDVSGEDRRLLEELVQAPSLARASRELWELYRSPLVELSRRSGPVRRALLELLPKPANVKRELFDLWFSLLDECGALEELVTDASLAPATWLGRWIGHFQDSRVLTPAAVLPLVRRLAPRLKKDGTPLRLDGGSHQYHRVVDLDLCDLVLELEIPLTPPLEDSSFNLGAWAEASKEGGERPRDPVRVAADARLGEMLADAVANVIGTEPFESLARGKKGLEAGKRAWLTGRLDRLEGQAVPALAEAVNTLERSTSARTFAELPDLHERLRRVDPSKALARTLRGAVFDELGWALLDDAIVELAPDGKTTFLHYGGLFPYLVVSNGVKAIVLSAKGRVLEHDLRIPAGSRLAFLRYAEGQLLVVTRGKSYEHQAYWSGSPTATFELGLGYRQEDLSFYSVELAGGGMTEGDVALRAGDHAIKPSRLLSSDGTTFWSIELEAGAFHWRELDPRTGSRGRRSLPRFLEEFVAPGWKVDERNSVLVPLPAGLESSPLGARDGLHGWRVRESEKPIDGAVRHECEGIDGRRFACKCLPTALVVFPGDPAPRAVQQEWRKLTLRDPSNHVELAMLHEGGAYAAGTASVLPLPFWHFLRPRDERGSAALRALSDATARTLLAEARKELERAAGQPALPATEQVVARLLPEVTHPRLRLGLRAIVGLAARLASRVDGLVVSRDPAKAPAPREVGADLPSVAVLEALAGLVPAWAHDKTNLGTELVEVSEFLSGRSSDARTIEATDFEWTALAGRLGAAAFRAVAPGVSATDRDAILRLLELWATSALCAAAEELRVYEVTFPPGGWPWPEVRSHDGKIRLVLQEGRRLVIRSSSRHGYQRPEAQPVLTVIERSLAGKFENPTGGNIIAERALAAPHGTQAWLAAFVKAARERGPLPWSEDLASELSRRTGLSRTEAALVWTGFLGFETYGASFISKETRELLGLKAAEAAAARDALKHVERPQRLAILSAAVPADPTALWTPLGAGPDDEGSLVACLARAWTKAVGKRAAVPDDLLAQCARELAQGWRGLDARFVLTAFSDPAQSEVLNRDGTWTFNDSAELQAKEKEGTVFHTKALQSIAAYVPWLFLNLPVGDSLRASIPGVLELARARLRHRGLVVDLGTTYLHDRQDPKQASEQFLETFGGTAFRAKDGQDRGRDAGLLLAAMQYYGGIALSFRPALFEDTDHDRLTKLAPRSDTRAAFELVRGASFDAFAARVRETPVPAGQWEANPLLSCPDVVAKVRAKQKLGEDAAALYLQLLTLPAPTTRRVKDWNSWSTKQHDVAAAELVKKKLVLEAKRERAGRSLFLPGAWEPLKAPDLPVERWKLPLYEVTRAADGSIARPLPLLLPLEPVHVLFARAWARVDRGDGPRYEEVK